MMNLMNYAAVKVKSDKHFCVSWLPDGKAFVIYDIKEFTNEVVPKFFKASKFCSFTRKCKYSYSYPYIDTCVWKFKL
jgi:hypothetical protein